MKNHNVEGIANPKAAGIAPQEGIPGAMRVVYPETSPVQNFQAKVWVGGDSIDDAEYEDDKVKAAVAYLRSMDNRITSAGAEFSTSTYQLQQWQNLDPTYVPPDYNHKWKLSPLKVSEAHQFRHVRAPRPSSAPDTFTFYIDTDKFVSGTYKYKVISFEKLEKKLHLMSRWPLSNPDYKHIEDDMVVADIFDNKEYLGTGYNDSPIVAEGTFTAESGDKTIVIQPMWFNDPEGSPNPPISLTDFIIFIKPD